MRRARWSKGSGGDKGADMYLVRGKSTSFLFEPRAFYLESFYVMAISLGCFGSFGNFPPPS